MVNRPHLLSTEQSVPTTTIRATLLVEVQSVFVLISQSASVGFVQTKGFCRPDVPWFGAARIRVLKAPVMVA